MVMGDFRRRQYAFQRRFQLHQQRLRLAIRSFSASTCGERRVGAGMNTDDILTFGVNKNQRHAGCFPATARTGATSILSLASCGGCVHRYRHRRCTIKAISAPLRPAATAWFTAERHLILVPVTVSPGSGKRQG
jgi:hypothetical protein